jgi:hypothetical protein
MYRIFPVANTVAPSDTKASKLRSSRIFGNILNWSNFGMTRYFHSVIAAQFCDGSGRRLDPPHRCGAGWLFAVRVGRLRRTILATSPARARGRDAEENEQQNQQ